MNTVAMTQTPPGGSPLRRFSNLLYRRPNLYLSMLLVPPLIWFGAIYLGSLLFGSQDGLARRLLPRAHLQR